jgi:hypothetical protein
MVVSAFASHRPTMPSAHVPALFNDVVGARSRALAVGRRG